MWPTKWRRLQLIENIFDAGAKDNDTFLLKTFELKTFQMTDTESILLNTSKKNIFVDNKWKLCWMGLKW